MTAEYGIPLFISILIIGFWNFVQLSFETNGLWKLIRSLLEVGLLLALLQLIQAYSIDIREWLALIYLSFICTARWIWMRGKGSLGENVLTIMGFIFPTLCVYILLMLNRTEIVYWTTQNTGTAIVFIAASAIYVVLFTNDVGISVWEQRIIKFFCLIVIWRAVMDMAFPGTSPMVATILACVETGITYTLIQSYFPNS